MRVLLAAILVLGLLPAPGVADSPPEGELGGLRAIMGTVRKVDAEERILVVERHSIRVPKEVADFETLQRGQRVVVRLDPEAKVWTATVIEVLR
jgi:hypothetical protein